MHAVCPAPDGAPGRAGRRTANGSRPRRARVWFLAAAVVLTALHVACIDEVAGLFVDDAWYLVLARALASGEGFSLTNAPVGGVVPFYPPGFPAVLSLVFLIAPSFPENVWAMKLVSVAALGASALLLRRYFVAERGLAPGLASLLGLLVLAAPTLHLLATQTVMSEPVFLFAQAAAILCVERASRRGGASWLLLAAALVAAALLVRSMGVALAPAAALYVARRAGLRRGVLLAVLVVAALAPFRIYAARHAPTAEQRALVNDPIVAPYQEQFWMKRAGLPEFGRETLADLPGRAAASARHLVTRNVGRLFAFPLLERLGAAGDDWAALPRALSALLAALVALGAACVARRRTTVLELYVAGTIALLLLWPFDVYRHLLPLLPYLAWYAGEGAAAALRGIAGLLHRRDAPTAAARGATVRVLLVAAILGANTAGLLRDVADLAGLAPGRRTGWKAAFAENLAVLAWVRRHVPRTAVLASHNPAMVHLYTGNPTVGSFDADTNLANWQAAGALLWVDNTVARYRHPDFSRSDYERLLRSPRLGLGVYRLPRGSRRRQPTPSSAAAR